MLTMTQQELSAPHKNAYIAFFVAHSLLLRRINQRLAEAGVVSLETYDILLDLEEAPQGRLRMSELADRALLSRSGITRLADRLENEGLLERQQCPNDRRACHAAITEKGRSERERAWPVYRTAIAEEFAVHMSPEEARVIAKVFFRSIGDHVSLIGVEPDEEA